MPQEERCTFFELCQLLEEDTTTEEIGELCEPIYQLLYEPIHRHVRTQAELILETKGVNGSDILLRCVIQKSQCFLYIFYKPGPGVLTESVLLHFGRHGSDWVWKHLLGHTEISTQVVKMLMGIANELGVKVVQDASFCMHIPSVKPLRHHLIFRESESPPKAAQERLLD